MTAIVTYARNRIALVASRSLARHGVRVITADSIYPAMSFFSRYCKGHFLYPSPMRRPTDFVECLLFKAREHGASVVIPSHEETYVLAQHRSVMEDQGIAVPVMDPDTILKVHDKAQSVALADQLGIPIPRTWYPTKGDDIPHIASQAKFPVVVKLRKGRGSIGLGYAGSGSELSNIFHRSIAEFGLEPDRYPLVQEYIRGTGVGVSMLFDHGHLKAQFTHLRLKEFPVTGGTSVERVSISFPEAEEYARRILTHLNWHGVAMVEFRVDTETQKPYFLEINPVSY
ncbi:MAG: ATP-grasp domain-containing protein, partial [Dehalococcoidia bacterium]|nr:ATP-grasp domain-containing protein [Dehalococcoidia bacterium]